MPIGRLPKGAVLDATNGSTKLTWTPGASSKYSTFVMRFGASTPILAYSGTGGDGADAGG